MKSLPKINIAPSTPICLLLLAITLGIPYVIAVATATALHEMGHIAAIYSVGSRVSRISLRPFGAVIERCENKSSYLSDAVISLSGPAVNLLSFLICFLVGSGGIFGSASLVLALVNLIPARPLDGYCALRSLCLTRMSVELSVKICTLVSLVFLSVLWAFSIYMLIYANFNVSLLLTVTFLMFETLSKI